MSTGRQVGAVHCTYPATFAENAEEDDGVGEADDEQETRADSGAWTDTRVSAAFMSSERRRSGEGARRTYDAAHSTDAVDVVVDVRADGDGDVLSKRSVYVCVRGWKARGPGRLTTTITMVLWPSEKKRPHVTGSCPMLMRFRVALSMALRRAQCQRWTVCMGMAGPNSERDAYQHPHSERGLSVARTVVEGVPDMICI